MKNSLMMISNGDLDDDHHRGLASWPEPFPARHSLHSRLWTDCDDNVHDGNDDVDDDDDDVDDDVDDDDGDDVLLEDHQAKWLWKRW